MALLRTLHKTWTYSSSCLRHARGYSRNGSSFSGSRYVSNPVDDEDNKYVVSKLLVYEKRRKLKKTLKVAENDSAAKVENAIIHETPNRLSKRKVSHCTQKDDSQDGILSKLKTIKRNNKYCCIIGEDAAKTIVKHVKKDLREDDVIVEANLGAGILTSILVSETSQKIVGFEPTQESTVHLQSLSELHTPRFELHNLDLFKFYWYYMLHKREPYQEVDKLQQLLAPLPIRGDETVSPVKILTSVYDKSFLNKLSLSFTFQCCFYKDIFPVFYVYIPGGTYDMFISSSKKTIYRKLKYPFIYYFDIEHLDTAPNTSFYYRSSRKKRSILDETFHLVKITVKENVHEVVPKEELEIFHYFIQCLNRSRKTESLIYQMEKWIPGCGVDYIKNGFRMFIHPRELSPEDLLEVYRLFISLPSFKECMFHHMCENWTIQFGLKDDELLKEDEEDMVDMDDDELTDILDFKT